MTTQLVSSWAGTHKIAGVIGSGASHVALLHAAYGQGGSLVQTSVVGGYLAIKEWSLDRDE